MIIRECGNVGRCAETAVYVADDATAGVTGGSADDFGFTVQAGPTGTVLGFTLTGKPITPGTSVLTVVTLNEPVEMNEICLVEVVLSDPAALAVPVSVICGGSGFEADVIYTVEPVTVDGILTVLLQSKVAVSGYQFDVFELDGTPVDIVAASQGLSGRVVVWLSQIRPGMFGGETEWS